MEIDELNPKTEDGQVRLWLDRIRVAQKYRDRVLEDMGVDRFKKYYFGEYDIRLGRMQVPPINDVFNYVQTLTSLLNFRNPCIAVNPRKTGTIKGARILEQCIAYDWRILKIKDECDLALIDCPISGMGWHKTGYWSDIISDKGEVKGLKDEGIYSNRVSWKDIVFNVGARRVPNDCIWIANRIVKPTYEVKEMYPGNSNLNGSTHPSLSKNDIRYANFKDDLNYTTIWEVYDKKEKKIFIVAEGYEKFLKKPISWPTYMTDFPFDLLSFNSNPDEPFPIPDIKMAEPQILEEIKLIAQALNHVKRWNRMLLLKKGTVDPQEQDKIEMGIDGTFAEINGNPNESHAILQYGPLPPDVYAVYNRLEEIKNRTLGITGTSMGGTDVTKTRTVGELEMMQRGSGQRTDKKRDKFERYMEGIARKLIAIRQSNFDLQQIVKITGELPQDIIASFEGNYDKNTNSIVFTKDDIRGEYDVDLQAGSTLALDKTGRMSALTLIIEKGAQLLSAPALPPFMQVAISELVKDYEIKSLEAALNAQQRESDVKSIQDSQSKVIDDEKKKADIDKKIAQSEQIKLDTTLKGADAMIKANQLGVLPELIELGRSTGRLPMDNGPIVRSPGVPGDGL